MKFKITCNLCTRISVVKKFISSSLIVGLLFNSVLYSFASTLSEDGRYETFEGSRITIGNVLEEAEVDVEVEGNTMVNLVSMPSVKSLNVSTNIEKATILSNFANRYNIKPNTEYTYFMEVRVTNASNNFVTSANLDYVTSEGVHVYHSTRDKITLLGNGQCLFKLKFTTGDDVSRFYNFFTVARSSDESTATGTQEVLSMVLLEGNYIDNDLSYFEGIKSVGEYEDDISNITINSCENKISHLDRGTVASSDGVPYDWIVRLRTNLFEVSSNKINIRGLSDKETSLVFCYDENKNYLGKARDDWNKDRYEIQLKNNTKYVYVVWRISDDVEIFPEDYKDVAIYETVNSNKKEILLNEPLRGLDNRVKDRIIKKNGQWFIERNCREIVYDGSEDEKWVLLGDNSPYLEISISDIKTASPILCDKLAQVGIGASMYDNPVGLATLLHKAIRVKPIEGNNMTLEQGKSWLKSNPITVVYQLETPTYEPLSMAPAINLYLDITHISNNSNIPASMKIVVDRVANRTKEAIELMETNPTIENLSQARYWSNLMKESTLKDSFQGKINNITSVEDLTIEKKSATINADIYIKSKNTLSLSIDTNSIVFDEVDATENTEMLNAVNLTVSSSLPYKVNAYLEEEIYNSDKSQILDKSALNIKANNKNEYKVFTDLSSPLTLLDDQDAGTDNIHGVDLKLIFNAAHKADTYKTTIKFEAEQK